MVKHAVSLSNHLTMCVLFVPLTMITHGFSTSSLDESSTCTSCCPVLHSKLLNQSSSVDLKTFIYKNGTYTDLISSNKYELEQKSPMDLFKYIKNNFSVYSLQIEEVNTYNSLMDSGNARQVFDYILSRNLDEKITSFTNVFFKCKECHFSRPSNLFFVYYFAQQLYDNLVNVKKDMIELAMDFSSPADELRCILNSQNGGGFD